MGLFSKNYDKIIANLGKQGLKELSNDWDYVLTGYYVVNRNRLESTIELGRILGDINQYYAMSPLVDEVFAKRILDDYGIPAFRNHHGVGFSLQEFYCIITKQLQDTAGFTRKELNNVEQVEKSLDRLGLAQSGVVSRLPVTHIKRFNEKASKERKMGTPVMIGDVMNILGYYANKIGNGENPTVKKFYKRVIKRLGRKCNLTDLEINEIIESAEKAKESISTVRK